MRVGSTGSSLVIQNLNKTYGGFAAVKDVTINVEAGEFVALLGPSGSGKTTILMSIAGFETPTSGDILLDGKAITALAPHERGIGMVFQRYALFPHLSVAENIAYPLRRRGVMRSEIERKVARSLELVRLPGLGHRAPAELSGGQQQRVALARALVFQPPVLLMDEPLGALDQKLRQEMQIELKLIHKEIGTTIVMVTHDQEEALSMADRVAVLDHGILQQVGSPRQLYEQPANRIVANFIGQTNFFPVLAAQATPGGTELRIEGVEPALNVPEVELAGVNKAVLGIRPEHIRLTCEKPAFKAQVLETAYGGATISMLLQVGAQRFTAKLASDTVPVSTRPGDIVGILFEPGKCRIYSGEADQ